MSKSTFRISLLVAALGFATCAFAATPPSSAPVMHAKTHMRAHHAHAPGTGVFDQLNLTAAQRAKIHDLVTQNVHQVGSDMQPMRPIRRAFYNAAPGSAEYAAATSKLAWAAAEQAHARVLREAQLRSGIFNVLTPEQRTEFAKLRAQRQQQLHAQRAQERAARHAGKAAPATSAPASH